MHWAHPLVQGAHRLSHVLADILLPLYSGCRAFRGPSMDFSVHTYALPHSPMGGADEDGRFEWTIRNVMAPALLSLARALVRLSVLHRTRAV